MARRVTFSQFKDALEDGSLPVAYLSDYLEFDEDSPVPELVFRYDALLDSPDANYDVDLAVYKYLRDFEEQELSQTATFGFLERELVVAEGDSWYNLPWPFRPRAIANVISKNRRFHVKNIACWSHTLTRICDEKQHLDVIDKFNPTFFMFCGGGNDLQKGLARKSYLHPYSPDRPLGQYLTRHGRDGIREIEDRYRGILDEVSKRFQDLRILCHGYDYPRPLVRRGRYIGRHLKHLNIPEDAMDGVVRPVLDTLNKAIQNATDGYESASFIDLRGKTDQFTWYDDMHPGGDGYKCLAKIFEDEMSLNVPL